MPTQSEPLHAPPELMAVVREHRLKYGIRSHKATEKVVPFVQINENINPWTPQGEPRWVAQCPECTGAEVVPAEGNFECGSCGASAEVDWSDT